MLSVEQIRNLQKMGQLNKFYWERGWKNLSKQILDDAHRECQLCKRKGKFTRAVMVHHIKHLEDRPDLAYDRSNLIALCFACHEEQHPEKAEKFAERRRKQKERAESRRKEKEAAKYLNEEWFG